MPQHGKTFIFLRFLYVFAQTCLAMKRKARDRKADGWSFDVNGVCADSAVQHIGMQAVSVGAGGLSAAGIVQSS